MLYVISSSLSSSSAVISGKVWLFPVEFSVAGYETAFKNNDIVVGFINSAIYMVLGTAINVSVTLLAAYPLAQHKLLFRNFFSLLFAFTMYFSGGIIPSYILVRELGMMNSIWAMIVPGALSVYNMIVVRTYMQTNVPGDLQEAAEIDGCNYARFFTAILLPLCIPVIAVVSLFYAVGHWNSYFNAFLYLTRREIQPLQIVLRDILISNSFKAEEIVDPEMMKSKRGMQDLLKYTLMVISALPMMMLYPFIQRFFIKGMMIGSIKG